MKDIILMKNVILKGECESQKPLKLRVTPLNYDTLILTGGAAICLTYKLSLQSLFPCDRPVGIDIPAPITGTQLNPNSLI